MKLKSPIQLTMFQGNRKSRIESCVFMTVFVLLAAIACGPPPPRKKRNPPPHRPLEPQQTPRTAIRPISLTAWPTYPAWPAPGLTRK